LGISLARCETAIWKIFFRGMAALLVLMLKQQEGSALLVSYLLFCRTRFFFHIFQKWSTQETLKMRSMTCRVTRFVAWIGLPHFSSSSREIAYSLSTRRVVAFVQHPGPLVVPITALHVRAYRAALAGKISRTNFASVLTVGLSACAGFPVVSTLPVLLEIPVLFDVCCGNSLQWLAAWVSTD